MPVRDPKSKLVSFRLSAAEYRVLQDLCEAREERSISDFVRRSLQQIAADGEEAAQTYLRAGRVAELRGQPEYDDTPSRPPEASDFGLTVTRALLDLNRKTEALDRKVRRLGLMVMKRY